MKTLLMNVRSKKLLSYFIVTVLFVTAFSISPSHSKAAERVIRVTTTDELHMALKTAVPGDEIIIAAGTYIGKLGSASGHGSSWFNSDVNGTKNNPIILRSESTENKAVLSGSRNTGNVLRITGDYWIIKDIDCTQAQKGIMLDNSNYSIISNCKVYNVGMEGIHLRDNSSYNLVENCTVTETGTQTPDYGEAIYVGSAKSSWSTYGENCHYNIIKKCTLGPNVTAEHVDIKEGTFGTIVEECIMYGKGISGKNYADSFIDIKGNEAVIRNNIGYRENNSIIIDAFQLHNQLDNWGNDNEVYNNKLYMDDSSSYAVNAVNNTSAVVYGNVRYPEGNMYKGSGIKVLETTVPPTEKPISPTVSPSTEPTASPTMKPTIEPTMVPTEKPADTPSPTNDPVSKDTYINTRVYTGGDIVVYQGNTYKAKWWTQGTAPDPNNQWGPWQLIGEAVPTPIPTEKPAVTPTVKPTSSPTVQPTVSPTLKPTPAPTSSPSDINEWALYTYYAKDSKVSYEGVIYKAIQPHTSLPGWTPAAIPALWSKQ